MKKCKSIWMALLTVILSVAMVLGTGALSAFAAEEDLTATTVATHTVVKRVEYGKATDAFNGASKLVTPNGSVVTSPANGYTPRQVGAYTVWFGNYSYVVSCYLDQEFDLRVQNGGAEIATYLKTGASLKLPTANVWVPSDKDAADYNGEDYVVYKDGAGATVPVSYKIDGPESKTGAITAETQEVALTKPGSYNVRYFARIGGADGTKYLYKDFTVKVQDNFEDTASPSLTVVNVPSSLSLNTKVTLPKATVTDNYDGNVKVEITVQQLNKTTNQLENVKQAVVDKNGYAIQKTDKDVVFDNEYNRSFYPMEETDYTITYIATDDSGNKNTTNHVYTNRTTADRTAPVLVDIDDASIPTVWGLNSVKDKNGEVAGKAGVITFPRPNYVDNSGKTPTVVFELRDTVNNNVVVRFDNINDFDENNKAGSGATYKYSSGSASRGLLQQTDTENGLVWDKENGLTLNLKEYTDHLEEGKTATGTYTVRYEVRDSVPNITTKTYDITLEDSFADTDAPSVTVKYNDEYLLFTATEEEFTIPTVVVTDNRDSRPDVQYRIYTDETAYFTVEGGEVAKIYTKDGGAKAMMVDKVEHVFTADTLVYEVIATDDAGNVKTVSNKTGNEQGNKAIRLISDSDLQEVENAAIKFTKNSTCPDQLVPGTTTTVGSFSVELGKQYRKFYGFELSLYTKSGDNDVELWSTGNVSLLTYFDPKGDAAKGELRVDDITFAAPAVDKVFMFFRLYDAAGASKTAYKAFDCNTPGSEDGGEDLDAALSIATSGSAYATYQLKNSSGKFNDFDPARKYIVRKVEATGKFGIINSQFTAYNSGTFTFSELYYKNVGTAGAPDYKLSPVNQYEEGRYTMTVTDTATPAWQVQGDMPTYTALKQKVVLPMVIASAEYSNARIELSGQFTAAGNSSQKTLTVATVAGEQGKDISLETVTINGRSEARYSFEATQDGTYTLTYTAYYGNGLKITQDFTVKAGDVVPPTFTVGGDKTTRMTENDTFTFAAVTLTSSEDTIGDVQFTKRLKAPDGSTVYTVDGKGTTYASATTPTGDTAGYTFTKTGTYTVEYVVTDKAGNDAVESYTITVSAAKVNNPVSTKIISTILIIVGVLLIAGVILYFVRFRKVKSK